MDVKQIRWFKMLCICANLALLSKNVQAVQLPDMVFIKESLQNVHFFVKILYKMENLKSFHISIFTICSTIRCVRISRPTKPLCSSTPQ